MSWHSDNEPELGLNPTIASLSFGGTRRFRFRNTSDKKQTLSINLSDASLLVMAGPLQHNWQHTLPKTKKGASLPLLKLVLWISYPTKPPA
jgi:alkylated DNA repair dioxygenase AlkB